MKKFLKIMLIIIGAISLIFVALIGIGLFVDVEYDDHIENGRYTYVPEEENKGNEYIEFKLIFLIMLMKPCIYGKAKNMIRFSIGLEMITMIFKA